MYTTTIHKRRATTTAATQEAVAAVSASSLLLDEDEVVIGPLSETGAEVTSPGAVPSPPDPAASSLPPPETSSVPVAVDFVGRFDGMGTVGLGLGELVFESEK
mmetsp:Transcript_23308/g.72974  ORF Transcript_23308/g.72974 Transcript_23308/m.72974 type:complete len:103 (-) Transcript_23308:3805-4113(-)